MPLTKKELIDMLYAELNVPRKECINLVESFFDIIKDELAKGNNITISGFGKWSVRQKSPRIGRDPQTGGKITIDARRVITFKSAPKLRSIVNHAS